MLPRVLCLAVVMASALPLPAIAQTVGMSCAQAVATYERTGRITITSRSGAVLPLYDGVPASQRSGLRCPQVPISVIASDTPRCTIAYKCGPRAR